MKQKFSLDTTTQNSSFCSILPATLFLSPEKAVHLLHRNCNNRPQCFFEWNQEGNDRKQLFYLSSLSSQACRRNPVAVGEFFHLPIATLPIFRSDAWNNSPQLVAVS